MRIKDEIIQKNTEYCMAENRSSPLPPLPYFSSSSSQYCLVWHKYLDIRLGASFRSKSKNLWVFSVGNQLLPTSVVSYSCIRLMQNKIFLVPTQIKIGRANGTKMYSFASQFLKFLFTCYLHPNNLAPTELSIGRSHNLSSGEHTL